MRTTVEIADSLLAEARQLAAARSITLRQLIEEGLRKASEAPRQKPFRLRDGSFGARSMRRKMTWEEIRELSSR